MMTRAELFQHLAAAGVEGEALDCLLRETGRERHQHRILAAILAAEEYVLSRMRLDRDEMTEATLRLHAGMILAADMIGIGGREDCEGKGTVRHPALLKCGKGRKQANDGPAWTAAILHAANICSGYFQVLDGHLIWSGESGNVLAGICFIPPHWIISILREGLRRAAGLKGWHPSVRFHTPPESLPEWGRLLNEELEALEDCMSFDDDDADFRPVLEPPAADENCLSFYDYDDAPAAESPPVVE